jgi:mono/diheme cytochrome c family protein
MKRFTFSTAVLIGATIVALSSCGDDHRKPGSIYMPDMAYSRAVETYAVQDTTRFTTNPAKLGKGNFSYYNSKPVEGTIQVNELFPYTLPNDSVGYKLSAEVKNPLPPLTGKDSAEAARLFNINCAICHGAGGAANGPLATSGKVGGVANLTTGIYLTMADGTMYHSIQYGKNNMGSYASQLSRKQRWQMVQYIRALQPKPTVGAAAAPAATAAKDTSTTKAAK